MNHKISVVVPVYNVEDYIEECISSIMNQTYDNLEIVLVDDGSTDQSSVICDNYSLIDSRIRVIHKKNGGLSDARNAGIQAMTGDYVCFVDSDDWIEPDMLESMMRLLEDSNAQIAEIGVRFVYPDHNETQIPKKCGVFNNIEVVAGYLDESIGVRGSACNKLYDIGIIKNNMFQVGRLHEDGWFLYKALYQCERYVNTDKIGYNYRQMRVGSIMDGARKGNHKSYIDTLDAFEERNRFFASKGEIVLQKKAEAYYYRTMVTYLRVIAKLEGKDSDFRKMLAKKIKSQEKDIWRNKYLGIWKLKYLGLRILNPTLFL